MGKHENRECAGDHPHNTLIGRVFGELAAVVQAQKAAISGPPFIVYHDVIDTENDGDIELCIPTSSVVESTGRVVPRTLAGGAVSSTMHKGPYGE